MTCVAYLQGCDGVCCAGDRMCAQALDNHSAITIVHHLQRVLGSKRLGKRRPSRRSRHGGVGSSRAVPQQVQHELIVHLRVYGYIHSMHSMKTAPQSRRR